MFRFVALSWNPTDCDSTALSLELQRRLHAQSPEWRTSFATSGHAVLHIDAREGATGPCSLENHGGVVLGTLFPRTADAHGALKIESLPESESTQIVRSRGMRLVDRYWGRYVAFLIDRDSNDLWILRDPVGAIPCYATTFQRLHILYSFAGDAACLEVLSASINWEFLAAHVHRPRFLRCSDTALKGVTEILPGECWHLREGTRVSRATYWKPTSIAASDRILDPHRAIAELRDTTGLCVSAWASCYRRVVHLLSGGLDSSIVLRCLRQHQPSVHVTPLTFFNSFSASADERHFARLAVSETGCELQEIEENPAQARLEVLLDALPSVRPWDTQYYQTHMLSEKRVTDTARATAVFSGQGGDHLFLQGPVELSIADYVTDRGPDGYWLHLCAEIACREGLSIWPLLRDSLRRGWRFQKWKPDRHIRKLLLASPDVARAAHRSGLLDPPWLADAGRTAYGKLEHIRMCSVQHDYYHPFGNVDSPERVSPLISQPLIELCLRIPLYLLAYGGQDRMLARQAFAGALPAAIVSRRSKGTADSYIQKVFSANQHFVRELLIDGMLVANGFLDRKKLETALSPTEGALRPGAAEALIFHVNTEAWLRKAVRGR
jgi:asparagine synthase (glutamine-hydrolysing)